MDPTQKALELSSQYGIVAVSYFMMAVFLGSLILYIIRKNERSENKYFDLITKTMKDDAIKMTERHDANQAAMTVLAKADEKQREEHDVLMAGQKLCLDSHTKTTELLDKLIQAVSAINCQKGV